MAFGTEIYLQGDYSIDGSIRLVQTDGGLVAQKLTRGLWSDYPLFGSKQSGIPGPVVTHGDSLMAGNYEITSVGGSTADPIHAAQRGPMNWVQFLTGHALQHRLQNLTGSTPPGGDTYSATGYDFEDVFAWLPTAFSKAGAIDWYHFGRNDLTGSKTDEQIIDSFRLVIRKSLAAGRRVWFDTIYPSNNDGAADFTSQQETYRLSVNAALRAMEAEYRGLLVVFDYDPVFTDPSTGKAYSSMFTDGVHINSTGAMIAARDVIIPKLAPFMSSRKIKRNYAAAYNASTNPYGDLLTNGALTGTAGVIGTGFSGSAPTSWTTARTDGTVVTTVVSLPTMADWNGVDSTFIKFVSTADGNGADNETHRIAPTSTITTGVAIGEWYQCEVEVIVDATASGVNPLRSVYAELRDNGTNGPVSRAFNVGYTNGSVKDFFPEGSYRLLIRTFPIRAKTSSGLVLRLNVDIDGTKTGSRAVYFGRPVVRSVGPIPNENSEGPALYDDFLGDVIADQWNSRKGSDGSCVDWAINSQVSGAIRATTGAGAGATMAVNGVQLESGLNWKAQNGGLSMEARIKIEAITTCALYVGFTDQVSALEAPVTSAASANTITTNATDAVGFMFDTSMNTDEFWMVGVANDVDVTHATTGVAPVADTYITLKVEVAGNGTATFYINGARYGQIAACVTPSVALTPVITFFRRAATATFVDCDFIKVKQYR